ncbi:MAG: cytidylate kinase family protein [Clostridia bacterium]|nr:cytidylate kinase family protein [Clostridia bacterium]
MSNCHIISITGDIASGKGVVSKILSERLNYSIYKNGEYFRSLAREHNMTVKEFNVYCESHKEIDFEIENSAKHYAESHDNFIIDARLGWYAVPQSFKVYLKVDLDESARRLLADSTRGKVENYSSFEEAKREIAERFRLENERYYNLYSVKKEDVLNYDLVIDTTHISPEEVARKIEEEYYIWLRNNK